MRIHDVDYASHLLVFSLGAITAFAAGAIVYELSYEEQAESFAVLVGAFFVTGVATTVFARLPPVVTVVSLTAPYLIIWVVWLALVISEPGLSLTPRFIEDSESITEWLVGLGWEVASVLGPVGSAALGSVIACKLKRAGLLHLRDTPLDRRTD